MSEPAKALLSVNNIEVIYDHVILVLRGVSLEVGEGGIVALLGANGAGKTTTLKAISNLLASERGDVTKGSIEFRGERVDRLNPAELVRRGVVQVMEGRHCFQHLTVEENLLTGAFVRSGARGKIRADLDIVYNYFPRLKQRRKSQAVLAEAKRTTESAEGTLGFHATPSFAIEGPRTDGLELLGTPESAEQFEEAIARAG